MDKLKMKSKNLVDENIEFLSKRFPNCIVEGKNENGEIVKMVDFDLLKQELSKEVVEGNDERYVMNWPGKKQAMLTANSPISATLRPCREESVDFDNTKNLYIEGDNLDVIKLLRETYLNKIKMIYIDPPYNTGNDFVYEDDFATSADEYLENSNSYDEQGNRMVQNTETNGRFHSDWLSMMYSRLKLAKDLLSDDGAIFISIGQDEVQNVIVLIKEIFGEKNYISCIPRITKKTSDAGRFFAPSIDYIICSIKNKLCEEKFSIGIDENKKVGFKLKDDRGNYKLVGFYQASLELERSRNARYFIECPDGSRCIPPENKRWRTVESTFLQLKKENKIVFKNTETSPLFDEQGKRSIWNIYTKSYLAERLNKGYTPRDFIDNYQNNGGTLSLNQLKIPFDFSKPPELIKYLMEMQTDNKTSLILDFFSGSATTAHAVMQLNAEDGGNRQYIMVQLPELCDEESEAYKAGYKNICEIGKERIRRAGKKIKEENPDAKDLDIGFRVLKLDSSNMKDVYYTPNKVDQNLLDIFESNIKEDRTSEDLLFQVMLDMGVKLDAKIDKLELDNGKYAFNVNDCNLICCFEDDLTEKDVEKIAKMQPLYAVFKDSSMSSDSMAVNFDQIFETYSKSTVRKVL